MDDELYKKVTIGLTDREIKEKQDAGLVNGDLNVKTKTGWQIIRGHLFTLFNFINIVLFICILISGSYKNGLFIMVVIWNFATGVWQEFHAKKIIDKLSLLSSPKVNALRNGKLCTIQVSEILLGEIMNLKSGNQVCADCVILEGTVQVNESLITGESLPILKQAGDHLLSGSYIVEGGAYAEVEHIGEDNYSAGITKGAKYLKKSNSIIMNSVKKVVRYITIALIPLSALCVWKNFFLVENTFSDAMVTTVATISAMMPGGLLLLVSGVMLISVVQLSNHNTLAQDLYCIENLARVDVLCLDKTGTITEGKLKVENVIKLKNYDENDLKTYAIYSHDANETFVALKTYLGIKDEEKKEIQRTGEHEFIPFNSVRKWSLIYTKETGSLILGAAEMIFPDLSDPDRKMLDKCNEESKRVIAFAKSEYAPEGENLPPDVKLTAFIVMSDQVRSNAKDTLDFFKNEGVAIKVISGDSAFTASKIAVDAGLEGAEHYIDASTLETYEDIEDAVEKYTVFGRVTPYQKLDIIKALKKHGHVPAMIGDGANDVLALKEADCSIAMQSGSDAARTVSQMVLMDSNFASLPYIVAQGRKSVNNLQRSAALYLTKTAYAFILAILFIFIPFIYPFENIQVTLIGVVTVGIPSFFLALEPNNNRIKGSFLGYIFKRAIPNGSLIGCMIMAVFLISYFIFSASTAQIRTACTIVAIVCGFIGMYNLCYKMDKWKWLLFALLAIMAVAASLLFPGLFSFVAISEEMWALIGVCAVVYFIVDTLLFRLVIAKEK